jgi:hypothetical protein
MEDSRFSPLVSNSLSNKCINNNIINQLDFHQSPNLVKVDKDHHLKVDRVVTCMQVNILIKVKYNNSELLANSSRISKFHKTINYLANMKSNSNDSARKTIKLDLPKI